MEATRKATQWPTHTENDHLNRFPTRSVGIACTWPLAAEPVVSLRMADGSEVHRPLRDVRAGQLEA